jgi:hypothetical protein
MVLDIVLPPRKSGAWVTSTTHSPRCLPRPCPEDPIPLARVASTPGEPSRSVPCQTPSKQVLRALGSPSRRPLLPSWIRRSVRVPFGAFFLCLLLVTQSGYRQVDPSGIDLATRLVTGERSEEDKLRDAESCS